VEGNVKNLNQANDFLMELNKSLFREAKAYAQTEGISFVMAVGVRVKEEFLILSLELHPDGSLFNLELINDTFEQCKALLFSRCEPTFESVIIDNFGDSQTKVCIATSNLLTEGESDRNSKFEEWKKRYFSP
jgi:hypothetical protein